MVRIVGLEPTRAFARYPLKIVRLPFRHIRSIVYIIHGFAIFVKMILKCSTFQIIFIYHIIFLRSSIILAELPFMEALLFYSHVMSNHKKLLFYATFYSHFLYHFIRIIWNFHFFYFQTRIQKHHFRRTNQWQYPWVSQIGFIK